MEVSYWRIENIFFRRADAMLGGSLEDRSGPARHAPTLCSCAEASAQAKASA